MKQYGPNNCWSRHFVKVYALDDTWTPYEKPIYEWFRGLKMALCNQYQPF